MLPQCLTLSGHPKPCTSPQVLSHQLPLSRSPSLCLCTPTLPQAAAGPPALLASHGGSPLVGLWRGESCCWHSWEDVGITAPSGEGRLLHAMAACEKRSLLLRAARAAGAPRHVLSPSGSGSSSPSRHLPPSTSLLFLWAREASHLLQPFESVCGKDPPRKD